MNFSNFSLLLISLCFLVPSVTAANECWKFPRPLSYNETKIYLLTNTMVIGSTFNNLFPESEQKYEIDINLYYSLDTPLKSDSTSVTLKDLNKTKSILLTIDEEAITDLEEEDGAGKEVTIDKLSKLNVNVDDIKTQLNKLFVNLTISKSSILSIVGETNFTGIAWSCSESEAYVKEASTEIDVSKCYKFVNVGGKYGSYYAYPPKKHVYGTMTIQSALEDTITKLIKEMIPDKFIQSMALGFIKQLLPGLNVIASVEVDYIQSKDITKIDIKKIKEDTSLLLTENVQLITGVLDECIDEGVRMNEAINIEQLIRMANCFIKQNSTNVNTVVTLMSMFITIPNNITVSMDNITQFLPMAAEYFDGLYLNKEKKVTLMVDVGDDATIKAVGEEFNCSTIPDRYLLGYKEYIPMPKLNIMIPKELFEINAIYTYYTSSDNTYLAMIVNSTYVKNKLPSPLNTDYYRLIIVCKVETSIVDGETKLTPDSVMGGMSFVYAINDEAASNLAIRIERDGSKFAFNYLNSIDMTEFNSYIITELGKVTKISTRTADVTRGENPRGKGTFKINGVQYQDLDVYFEYPPEEFKIKEIPFNKVDPPDAKPLPRDKCYLFKANGGEFGDYYVDIQNGTVKGGISIDNVLKTLGDVIPPMVSSMFSFEDIFAWAEVKLDYIDHENLTKINVTEILESTYIQFTGLKTNAIVETLSKVSPELGLLNKPIYLSAFLKNIGGLLETVKQFLPPDITIPDGPLGLDNITQFLPMAYEYFEGMYWSDIRNKAEFTVVADNTVVNAIGKVINCSITPSTGLKETIPLDNYVFSIRNNLPELKGIYVLNGMDQLEKKRKIRVKLNCSDYPDLLPESMKDLNCYIRIDYDANSITYDDYTRIVIQKYSKVPFDKKKSVITVEPRDDNALEKMKSILDKTNPNEVLEHICDSVEYNSFIDLTNVEDSKKDEEAEKILGNVYDGLSTNMSVVFGRVELKYANIVVNNTGRVNLKNDKLKNVIVWSTVYEAPELDCNYVIPPYNGDDGSEDGDGDGNTSNEGSSVFISYFFGLIMIILTTAFM